MGENAPHRIILEVNSIENLITTNMDIDFNLLAYKKRLEMLNDDLKNEILWKRSNPENFLDLEKQILENLMVIEKKIKKDNIDKLAKDVKVMKKRVDDAVEIKNKQELAKLENSLFHARKDVERFKRGSWNEMYSEDLEDIERNILSLREYIFQFYNKLIEGCDKIVKDVEIRINRFSGTKQDYEFTIIHNKIDKALEELKTIDVKEPRSPITSRIKETINLLEVLRYTLNDKAFDNEVEKSKPKAKHEDKRTNKIRKSRSDICSIE